MNSIAQLALTDGTRLAMLALGVPVVACLVCEVAAALRSRASAATRHLVWLLAFVAMGVAVPAALLNLRIPLRILPPSSAVRIAGLSSSVEPLASDAGTRNRTSLGMPQSATTAEQGMPIVARVPAARQPMHHAMSWQKAVAFFWFSGFAAFWLTLLAGNLRLRRVLSKASVPDDPHISSVWEKIRSSSNAPGPLRLLISKDITVPLATGLWRPTIILPDRASTWSTGMLRAAILHEVAHIHRKDLLTAAFARAVATVYWFHPLVWYAARRMRAEAEMAADDLVVVAEAQPVAYAETLVALLRAHRSREGRLFPAVGMLRRRGIEARVARILSPDCRRLSPGGGVRWSAVFGTVALAVAGLIVHPVAAEPTPVTHGTPAPTSVKLAAGPMKIPLPPQEDLLEAIGENDLAKAEEALKAGADPNGMGVHRELGSFARSFPLYFAAERGRLDGVRFLLAHGATVNPAKPNYPKAIDAAMICGFSDVTRYLHEQGANCEPLAYAAAIGDLDSVAKLSSTATPGAITKAATTAAGCGQIETLRALLDKKADPKNAFQRAAYVGRVEVMQFLLDRGLDLPSAGYEGLLRACANRHTAAVTLLLHAGVKPNPEKKADMTPLYRAAESGAVEIVRMLLEAGADPNGAIYEEHREGSTPLFAACSSDSEETARLLLAHGSRLDVVNQGGFTPVLYAAYSHAPHCLAFYIDRGADTKVVNPAWKCGLMKFAMIFTGEDADRPDLMGISMAQISRNMEAVQVLFDKGMDVNATEEDGSTPISIAIVNGQTACMEMLLQRGARLNTIDQQGGTLLIRLLTSPVKEKWRQSVMDRLFAHGADPNVGIDNPKPVEYPCPSALKATMCNCRNAEAGHKLFGLLLTHGAHFPVEKDSDAEKMLLAASTGDLATVRNLLAKGVSPNVADRRGWTPLLSATALGYKEILRALVEAGADVNAHDALGYAALYFALSRFPDLTEFHLLLDKGADVNYGAKGLVSPTALYVAIGRGDPELVLEVLKRGASPEPAPGSDSHWFEPIELAVDHMMQDQQDSKGREVVKLLIQYGADLNLKREHSHSLLYFPVLNNNLEKAKLLLEMGVDPRKDRDGGKDLAEAAERYGNAEMKALVKTALEKKAGPEKDPSDR